MISAKVCRATLCYSLNNFGLRAGEIRDTQKCLKGKGSYSSKYSPKDCFVWSTDPLTEHDHVVVYLVSVAVIMVGLGLINSSSLYWFLTPPYKRRLSLSGNQIQSRHGSNRKWLHTRCAASTKSAFWERSWIRVDSPPPLSYEHKKFWTYRMRYRWVQMINHICYTKL